jgi:hypothetical protein
MEVIVKKQVPSPLLRNLTPHYIQGAEASPYLRVG